MLWILLLDPWTSSILKEEWHVRAALRRTVARLRGRDAAVGSEGSVGVTPGAQLGSQTGAASTGKTDLTADLAGDRVGDERADQGTTPS
jgi:hypothetical protein